MYWYCTGTDFVSTISIQYKISTCLGIRPFRSLNESGFYLTFLRISSGSVLSGNTWWKNLKSLIWSYKAHDSSSLLFFFNKMFDITSVWIALELTEISERTPIFSIDFISVLSGEKDDFRLLFRVLPSGCSFEKEILWVMWQSYFLEELRSQDFSFCTRNIKSELYFINNQDSCGAN